MSFNVEIPNDSTWVTDSRRLKIILNNLISNAIKYGDPWKQQRWVCIHSEVTTEGCTLSISDNGMGIPLEYQSKIFNMFYRASEKSNGSGLGLYIVKETVEKMGGKIEFKSIVGEGSTFFVRMPKK